MIFIIITKFYFDLFINELSGKVIFLIHADRKRNEIDECRQSYIYVPLSPQLADGGKHQLFTLGLIRFLATYNTWILITLGTLKGF